VIFVAATAGPAPIASAMAPVIIDVAIFMLP
jgi:hypothetical protein